jgi:hypothetical protein
MFKKENILIALVILAVILGVVGLFGDNKQSDLGGTTNFDAIDVTDGYYVDGTAVISGSSQLADGLTIAGAGATSSLIFSNYKTCIQVLNSVGSTTAITFVGSGATTTTVTATLGTCN